VDLEKEVRTPPSKKLKKEETKKRRKQKDKKKDSVPPASNLGSGFHVAESRHTHEKKKPPAPPLSPPINLLPNSIAQPPTNVVPLITPTEAQGQKNVALALPAIAFFLNSKLLTKEKPFHEWMCSMPVEHMRHMGALEKQSVGALFAMLATDINEL
jgi:hypothetical protein